MLRFLIRFSVVRQQFLSFDYTADLSKNEEVFNFDNDDNLLFIRQILAFLKRVIKIINFIYDDNSNNKDDNGNYIKVSWLRYIRTARHRVTLTLPFLINYFRIVD
jgi:hypothetical protein